MTSAQQGPIDPFEQGDGVPAVSFKDAPINSFVTIEIDDDAKWLQSRDYETGELAYWDARPGETPNPKMAAVVTGIVQPTPWAVQSGQVGERRSIWAGKPSSLFTAIQNAKRAAGGGSPVPILKGGRLDVAFTGEEPNKTNPRLNNIKQYAARYTAPPPGFGQQDAFEGNQAFTGQAPAQAAPVQQAPVQQQFAQQQAPAAAQPFAQPAPQQAPVGAPSPAPFGQPAQQQQPAAAAQPAGDPWSQPSGFGQGAPAPAQQPAMAAAAPVSGGDPWASAPAQDVPNF